MGAYGLTVFVGGIVAMVGCAMVGCAGIGFGIMGLVLSAVFV